MSEARLRRNDSTSVKSTVSGPRAVVVMWRVLCTSHQQI